MKLKLVNDWEGTELLPLIKDFDNSRYSAEVDYEFLKNFENIEWLFGSYTYESYSGDAYVLFKRDGKLFVVSGGHCSCYGLEGQWDPTETTMEAVLHELNVGTLGASSYGSEFKAELTQFLQEVTEEDFGART